MKYLIGKNNDIAHFDGRLGSYFSEIHKEKYNPLNAEEEKVVLNLYLTGDNSARDILIKRNLRYVAYAAKAYQHVWELSDLINEGNLGLIKGVQKIPTKFDPAKAPSGKILPFLSWYVQGAIVGSLYENNNMIKLPIHVAALQSKINKLQERSLQENNWELSPETVANEISEYHNFSYEEVDRFLQHPKICVGTSDVKKGNPNPDTLVSTEEPYENIIQSDEYADSEVMKESLQLDIRFRMNTICSPREKEILCAYFGLGESRLSLEQIEMKYDLTPERIRQIKERAIRRLRNREYWVEDYGGKKKIRPTAILNSYLL